MEKRVPEKENILKHIDEARLIELLKDLIRIPSPVVEESEIARFLGRYLTDNGLETEVIEAEANRLQPVARIRGTGGGYSLMFNGHMDTPVFGLRIKDPFVPRIEGRRLYGQGGLDMKAGVASMIEAALAVKKSGVRLKGDLIVTPVVGETQGGVGTVNNLKRGIKADFALVPEPKWEFFCLAHAGCMQVAITVIGRETHISRMEEGISVFDKMCKVREALKKIKFTYTPDPRFPWLPRMLIGSIICGHRETYDLKGANHVPDYGTMVIDIRFLPGMHPEKDIARVLEEIRREDPEFKYEMRVTPDDPSLPGMPWNNFRITMPFQELSPDELIVKVHAQNYKYLTGKEPLIGTFPVDHPHHRSIYAVDDDAHLTKAGIPSFTCGPGGGRDPTGLEYTEIDSMVNVAKNFALTAYDICTKSKD